MGFSRAVGLVALLAFVALILLVLGLGFLNIGAAVSQIAETLRELGQLVR